MEDFKANLFASIAPLPLTDLPASGVDFLSKNVQEVRPH